MSWYEKLEQILDMNKQVNMFFYAHKCIKEFYKPLIKYLYIE